MIKDASKFVCFKIAYQCDCSLMFCVQILQAGVQTGLRFQSSGAAAGARAAGAANASHGGISFGTWTYCRGLWVKTGCLFQYICID